MPNYINKEWAIEVVKHTEDMYPYKVPGEYDTYGQYNEGWSDACDQISCELEAMNAADVAPVVHAEWLHVEENKYKCSHCWAVTEIEEFMCDPVYIRCPFCGAIMDLEG